VKPTAEVRPSKSHAEKWASAALALMSLFLLAYLARQTGVWAEARPPQKPARSTVATDRERQRKDDLARFDPVVKLELLHQLQSRPVPHFNRNPFEYPAPKVAPAPAPAPAAPPVAQPPPPPPIKAMGYMEKAGGVREATVTDDADNIYVVHENDVFANHFKVLKISPTVIEIEDTTTQQSIQLPVPQ
jgi:hypothetical protein